MNAKIKVYGAEPFQVDAHSFCISASGQAYTLGFSADGVTYTDLSSSTPAGEELAVINVPRGCWWKLTGNTSTLTVVY